MKTHTEPRVPKNKQTRLLKPEQYDKVFSNASVRFSNKYILLLARETTLPYARLGLVVAKKKIPLAVNRNRFKRLAREHFRQSQIRESCFDIIILSRADISTLPESEQHEYFTELFSKLKSVSYVE